MGELMRDESELGDVTTDGPGIGGSPDLLYDKPTLADPL